MIVGDTAEPLPLSTCSCRPLANDGVPSAPKLKLAAAFRRRSWASVSQALSPDLQHELAMLALPFKEGEVPSEPELRVAKAQLVGWLEGLFHGIQATLFAQQLAARQQLEQMRQLPPGAMGPGPGPIDTNERPGTYL